MDDALAFVQNVYEGKYKNKAAYDKKRVNQYAKVFSEAVDKGWKDAGGKFNVDYDTPDAKMLAALRDNVFHFSAAKNRAEIMELSALLRDEKGKLRTWTSFKTEAVKVTADFQERYMKVEYDMAVNSAYLAARWQEYEDDDILVFTTAGDDRVRQSHRELDGVALPKSHKFWRTFYPPLAWNCRCTVVVTHSGRITPEGQIPYGEIDKVPPIFRRNFAIDGMAFPPEHPYFKNNETIVPTTTISSVNTRSGKIIESSLVDKKSPDYKAVKDCCAWFAENVGDNVEILPKLHGESVQYKQFFGALEGTRFYGKCPDLRIDDKFYELEGFTGVGGKNALRNMLNRGLSQSDHIIIENPGLSESFIIRSIGNRIRQGATVKEVWLKSGNTLKKIW